MKSIKRTRWNKTEKEAVFAEMVQHLRATPNLSDEDAINYSQTSLPKNRRRKFTKSIIRNYSVMIAAAREEANSSGKSAEHTSGLSQFLDTLADIIAARILKRW